MSLTPLQLVLQVTQSKKIADIDQELGLVSLEATMNSDDDIEVSLGESQNFRRLLRAT